MTIEQYKDKFESLFAKLEAEHGTLDYVHLERVEVENFYDKGKTDSRIAVAIKF